MHRIACLLAVLTMSACGSQVRPDPAEPKEELSTSDAPAVAELTGGVSVHLRGEAQGRRFHLARATFDVSGAASLVLMAPGDTVDDTLVSPLPPGSYATFLRPGYVLKELLRDGTERRLDAELVSANPALVHVGAGAPRTLALRFRVDGTIVDIGAPEAIRLSDRR
jgi:hypothetical protein